MISDEMIQNARALRLHLLKDPYRPAFHFVVPEDYARPADPNGAVFWNGRYHLGYIYQDQGVHFWGHVSSLDLLHWRHHPPCLFPTPDSPEAGIFSGNCFINKKGQATMLYHGVKIGNSIATSSDAQLDTWQKLPSNPIVPVESADKWRESAQLPYASWDPHGWLEGDTYYAIFGGVRPAVFKARELDQWQYVGDLFAHGVEGVSLREDVSCPDFFKLGDKWVLMGISHEMGCRYYVGEWRNEQFHPELHEQMSWVDNTYFAPESMLDPKGRRIMWAWVFDQSDEATQKAGGWSGVFGLPRELWLGEDHRLRMRPVEELKALRYNQRSHSQIRMAPNEQRLVENIQGNVLDLELVLEPFGADRCGIKVCCAPDGSEETIVGYDRVARTIYIDTQRSSSSGIGLKTVEAGPFHLADTELLHLRILIDKSVVEVYANERQAALRRIYPSHPESLHLKLFCEGGAMHVHRLTAWEMMPSNPY